MTTVQPFSYLTVQPAPSKPAFQRQDDDDDGLVETTLPASVDNFRVGNLNVQEDVGGHFSQSSAALAYEAMDYNRPQVNLGRSQTEASYDLKQHQQQQQQQQQPEMAFTGNPVKRPPDVAPKQQTKTSDPPPRMPDNWEEGLYGGANRGGGGALYEQSNPLSTLDRLQERTDPAAGEPDFGNASNNVYGQPNRQRKPDVQETRKAEPQLTTTNNYVPFSYTQPIGLSGVVSYGGDMESRNGVGSKQYYSPSPEPPSSGVRPRDSPSPPAVNPLENQTIFENFILVGPEKPPATSYPALLPPKEQPVKRLKLQELFDPPPPKQPAPVLLQDPRKLSIFGVTNTESSDYQSSANHTKKTNGGGDRTKTPVSTFDNPDYNLPSDGSRAYTPSGSVQGTSDDRSWSVGANNTFDNGKLGTATATAGFSKHRRPTPLQGREKRANNKTCIAVLITALVAGIFCLGAGFIAGWFGRGRSLGY